MKRLLPLLLGMVLVTAACKAEINYGFEVNADGSGNIVAEFGFDEEFMQLLVDDTGEPQDPFAGNALAQAPGATQERYTRGEFTFFKVTVPFTDVNELSTQAADEDSPFGQAFQVSVTDDKATFNADLSDRFVEETTGGGESSLEGTDLSLEDVFTIHIRVKLPGKVTSHNADNTVDGFLEWNVPVDGSPLVMQAESDPSQSGGTGGGGGFPVWLIVVIVAIVAIGGFYFYNQSQQKDAPAAADAPTPPAAPAADAPPTQAPPAPGGEDPEGPAS